VELELAAVWLQTAMCVQMTSKNEENVTSWSEGIYTIGGHTNDTYEKIKPTSSSFS
jgi:hypothetical protein